MIVVRCASKSGKIYCPQIFLEGYKYKIEEKKINKFFANDADLSSNNSADSDSKENFKTVLNNW